ncbi:uncharacterized protein LOC120015989 [Tripterygium wilfordii]|uniref:uncharacterized protein LOC120015989 n=1 Tax=Tripterygium wilfordii TaxID=458696 RepID=UPI0018F7FE6D|nr:uncharacterized protein LOC120015989 [Tripterygium wilfordii]
MGCGVSKFEVEEEDPKSVHVRRSDRHARIPKTKVEEDDVVIEHEEHARVMKRVVGADERPEVVVEKDNINREELIEPKKVVVVVPPPTVQVVYGGDEKEETPGREDSISCNPGSPSFRDYCIAHDSGDDEDDEEFGAKEEKISTKEGLLKGGKVSGTRATRRRRVRGLRSVLHRGSAS